jgi:hypothetical protein
MLNVANAAFVYWANKVDADFNLVPPPRPTGLVTGSLPLDCGPGVSHNRRGHFKQNNCYTERPRRRFNSSKERFKGKRVEIPEEGVPSDARGAFGKKHPREKCHEKVAQRHFGSGPAGCKRPKPFNHRSR